MKKISTYLIVAVAAGVLLTGIWVYEKYIKAPDTSNLTFTAERKDIRETVKARGEVVSQKDFDLQFPVSGTVSSVYVKEGDVVPAGTPLAKLDTRELELSLDKLLSHAAAKDVAVAEASVVNARAASDAASKALLSSLNDGYFRADDVVRGKMDALFTNPRTVPVFNYQVGANSFDLKNAVETERQRLETDLTNFKNGLAAASSGTLSDLSAVDSVAHDTLNLTVTFLQNLAAITNDTASLASYKETISAARTSINAAITNLTTADGAFSTAKTNLDLAVKTLDLKRAAVESEDADIGIARDKIAKSTLYAPIASRVTKVWLERQEAAQPGINAVSLSAVGYKLQSDISELDIGKITAGSNGNEVTIELDAFPGRSFKGRVVSVDPQPVLKDTDKYYRTNVFFEGGGTDGVEIRSGMSADLKILAEFHKNVVVIPEIAMFKSGGQAFVNVETDKGPVETKITTGISDGENIEVLSGLEGGETLIISS
ncbi:MAG: secretion protein HlyD [Parcubacteria group bacterium LiPW_15]|nr:MAG: secretion protein HlyD [Parcubacteria group bacterium LiPW_15]